MRLPARISTGLSSPVERLSACIPDWPQRAQTTVTGVKDWRVLFDRFREGRISLALFTFSVSVLVAAIFYVALSVEDLLSDYSSIASDHATLDGLATTRNSVEAQVNALRTYVITGNANLLADYRSAGSDITVNLAGLYGLADGSQPVLQRLKELEGAIREQSAVSSRIVETYQSGRLDSVRRLLIDEDTKLRTLDHVRMTIAAFESKERASLTASMKHANDSLRSAILAGSIGLILYFLVQCVVFARMDKELERRRGADSSLLKANAELEASIERLKNHNRVAQAISRFGDILQNCRTVKEAIVLALHQVAHFLPAVSAEIGLYDDSRNVVELYQWKGVTEGNEECPIVAILPEECWSLRRGKLHVYTEGGSNPRCAHIPVGATQSICIPILGQGETRGIMSLYTERSAASVADDWKIARNIAERMAPTLANLKLQDSLRNQSLRDQLTGLFNRRYLDKSLAREITRARRYDVPVSVMMLDIDQFKQFNDEHGHDCGDHVLASFGQLLVRSVRSEDIACRYGGEEFTLVLPGAAHELALQRAEEVRLATQRLRVMSKGLATKQITASIGVATFPAHGNSMEDLLAAADAALYLAKNCGRNRVVGAATLKFAVPQPGPAQTWSLSASASEPGKLAAMGGEG